MKKVKFIPRTKVKSMLDIDNVLFYDTSTHAPFALNFSAVINASEFSPFTPYGNIPVPKMDKVSDSVEGVWQGLKVIKGKTDFSYFNGKGRKRRGKPKGHKYGGKIIGYVEARKKIYIPTYEFMVHNCVPVDSLQQIYVNSRKGIDQYFFDVDDNGQVGDTSSPLAHASMLVEIINRDFLEKSPECLQLKKKVDSAFEDIGNGNYTKAKDKFLKLLETEESFKIRLGLGLCCFNEYLENKKEEEIDLTINHMERANYFFGGDLDCHITLAQSYATKFQNTKNNSFKDKALKHYELSLQYVSQRSEDKEILTARINELIDEIQYPSNIQN